MCGILGIIGEYRHSDASAIMSALKERGPDGSYYRSDKGYYIGLSRLSIVSPNDHNLPFIYGDISCVVNGEIYNHQELRNELVDKGYVFKTNIDTEVVLFLFIEYGVEFVKKLNGIFAIIIHNKSDNTLFVARDQIGIKPLYYTCKNNGYYFCSLAKPLAQNILPTSSINYKSLIKLLYRQSIPEPESIFDSVYSLPPGFYGIVKKSNLKIYQYYFLKSELKGGLPNENEFIALFQSAINKQSKMDTNKVAIALSNGVDSMLIGNLLNIKNLQGFNIPYNPLNTNYSNSNFFHFNIQSVDYIKYIDEAYQKWIELLDQPPMDGFNTFLLSYGIKKQVKVLYSGLGADELFNGYPQFNEILNIKSKEELILKFLKKTQIFPDWWLEKFSLKYELNFHDIKNEIINDMLTSTYEKTEGGNLLRELLIRYYLSPCLLRDADNNSMANGIEQRVPYLDMNLLKYSLSYNYIDFFNKKTNKAIIKRAFNQKIGFKYEKEKEGFALNYEKLLDDNDVYFPRGDYANAYRNWCLKNVNQWCKYNEHEDCNIYS